jgi:hypothetical protein
MNKLLIALIAAMILAVIGFALSGIVNATSQANSTNVSKQKIIVTWLETNDTKINYTPVISVSSEDFWMIFEPLLKQSINGSAISSE